MDDSSMAAGMFKAVSGDFVEATEERDGPVTRRELMGMLEVVRRAGHEGVKAQRTARQMRGGRRLRAYHCIELLCDIGLVKWREGKGPGGTAANPVRVARITAVGAEVKDMLDEKGDGGLWEAVAKAAEGAEAGMKLAEVATRLAEMMNSMPS